MLLETGRVVAIDESAVWVETLRQNSCGKCAARSGCGHGMLNAALPGGSLGLVKAGIGPETASSLGLNDTVEIALPEQSFLRGAAMLYLLPILSTVVAAMLADRYWVDAQMLQSMADLRVGVGAVAGLLFGLSVLRLMSHSGENNSALLPQVTRKLHGEMGVP